MAGASDGSLASLSSLSFHLNSITSLPLPLDCQALGSKAVGLQRLILDCNKLRRIPNSVSCLVSLQQFFAASNRLQDFDFSTLMPLTRLQSCDLSFNRIPHRQVQSAVQTVRADNLQPLLEKNSP